MGFDANGFNRRQFRRAWRMLNAELGALQREHGLGAAVEALWAQQFHAGFVVSDPTTILRWRLHDDRSARSLAAQWNPDREKRTIAVGRSTPPPGERFVHDGCKGCVENMFLRSGGKQLAYEIMLGGHAWVIAANPFGMGPCHCVAFTRRHVPQSWRRATDPQSLCDLSELLLDLATLAAMLPSWIVFVNGAGAGATVPEHRHAQLLKRASVTDRYPLEEAVARARQRSAENPLRLATSDYPLAAVVFTGAPDVVAREAAEWTLAWGACETPDEAPTANAIAVAGSAGDVTLTIVPRVASREKPAELTGLVGSLEALGEIVITSERDKAAFDQGRVDYRHLSRALAAVEPPSIRWFLGQG